MKQTKCGNPGIVHKRTVDPGWPGDPLERIQVAFTFCEKSTGETGKKTFYGIQAYVHRCGVLEDTWVGDHRKKFVGTRPRNTDWLRRSRCLGQHLSSAQMEGHFRAMCIDEQVRVDRNHAPWSR